MISKKINDAYGFSVDSYGRVFDPAGVELKPFVKDGKYYVKINWICGYRDYEVGLLVIKGFFGLHINPEEMERVVVLYKDGCGTSVFPSNLCYKFDSPLECKINPGFYVIPYFTRYGVSTTGVVVNRLTSYILSTHSTKGDGEKNATGGYLVTRVINDNGTSKLQLVHRLMCLALLPYGSNVDALVTNHKDGKPWNNYVENLEWCTRKENNQHAIDNGLKKQCKPILLKCHKSGDIKRFPTMMHAARHLGYLRTTEIQRRIDYGSRKINADMVQAKFDDGSDWPTIDLNTIYIVKPDFTIVCKNVFSGDIFIFDKLDSASKSIGVDIPTIRSRLKRLVNIPINGWLIRHSEVDEAWPEFSGRHLEIFREFPVYPENGLIVKDIVTGEEQFLTRSKKALELYQIPKKTLYQHISSKKPYMQRYLFEIFDIRRNEVSQ